MDSNVDDFVGVSESGEQLQRVIDVVHSYCRKWRLKANVSKSAVMTFGKGSVKGSWKLGEQNLPRVSKYTYFLLRVVCGTCIIKGSGQW